ncbi:MAG TPA: hypothetical protein VKI43_03035 [Vicinamibacterales bacterium]|nr:hypothetical protein [Vicinamibacterales bacterium]
MSGAVDWYRSSSGTPAIARSARRAARDWVRGLLPEPDVAGKTMVVYSRQTFRSAYHGLFSEFHSVLGALAYAETRGAAGVRVDFRSPLYVEPARGPNWWTYIFERALMPLGGSNALEVEREPFPSTGLGAGRRAGEVHLDGIVTKYGKYGGFSDIVQGATPYLYPMTFGLGRVELRRLLTAHVQVRPDIADEAARFTAERFEPGAYVVGVHYRGTDATHRWTGALNHYRMSHVPYEAYADEVRRMLEAAAPRAWQIFVATDEVECLAFFRREFGDRVVASDDAPRAHAGGQAVHLDRGLAVSNYQKAKSAMVDCLSLAATSYLVKGRSNLSDASLAFNPSLPYSFCPDVDPRA